METSLTYQVRNEAVLHTVKEVRNTLHTVKSKEAKSCEETRKM